MQRWLHLIKRKLCFENRILPLVFKLEWFLYTMQPILPHGCRKEMHFNILINLHDLNINWRILFKMLILIHFSKRPMLFIKAKRHLIFVNQFNQDHKSRERVLCLGKTSDCLPIRFELCQSTRARQVLAMPSRV